MCDGVFWKARCRYRRLSSSDVHDLEINAPKEDVHHSNPLYAYHFPWILISKRHQYAFRALLFRVRCFFLIHAKSKWLPFFVSWTLHHLVHCPWYEITRNHVSPRTISPRLPAIICYASPTEIKVSIQGDGLSSSQEINSTMNSWVHCSFRSYTWPLAHQSILSSNSHRIMIIHRNATQSLLHWTWLP